MQCFDCHSLSPRIANARIVLAKPLANPEAVFYSVGFDEVQDFILIDISRAVCFLHAHRPLNSPFSCGALALGLSMIESLD